MKLKGIYRPSNLLTGLLLVVIVLLIAMLSISYGDQTTNNAEKSRDATRITDIALIHQAIRDYDTQYKEYPACLYKNDCTKSLEATPIMPTVSTDPLTHLGYSYAAFGTGASCQGYHLGTSLERAGSQALLTGSDSSVQPQTTLCAGSKPDFSGLSYAPGGQPCNAKAGVAAPSDSANAETCYDLAHELVQQTPSTQ